MYENHYVKMLSEPHREASRESSHDPSEDESEWLDLVADEVRPQIWLMQLNLQNFFKLLIKLLNQFTNNLVCIVLTRFSKRAQSERIPWRSEETSCSLEQNCR